jgi:hypothetical protein
MPTVICPVDKTKFHIPPSQLRRTKGPPTCSLPCKTTLRRGAKHWNYKGGYVDKKGFRRILVDGEYVMEHRVVLARKLKRKLRPTERVRWKNGDRLDNRPTNLALAR